MCTLLYVINYVYRLCSSWCSGWVFLSGVNFGPTAETAFFSKPRKAVGISVYVQKCLCKIGWPACMGYICISDILYHNMGWLCANILLSAVKKSASGLRSN